MRWRLSGTFTSTGQSPVLAVMESPYGQPNLQVGIAGLFTGSVQIERSRDSGVSWAIVSEDPTGTGAIYTAPADFSVADTTVGTQYRLNCTALSGGSITWDLAQ